jgi:peptide/nickel transport system permease protein
VFVYLVRRLAWALLTVLFVVTIVFFIFFILPGGGAKEGPAGVSPVAVLLAGRNAPAREMQAIQEELGLDRPVAVQYWMYVSDLVHGDLGFSFASGAPVARVIAPAIPPSVSIAAGASVVWVTAGTAIGVLSAHRRSALSDRVAMIAALAALSVPVFVVALVTIALLLQFTGVYAANRYVPLTEDPLGWLSAMWLPWICLAFPLVAVYARMVRSSVLEARGEEYIRTSWAKGLTEKQVLRHELRSGLTPIVTMYGLDFGLLMGGSVIIETIFRIPGLGSLLLQARTFYDFPLMSGIVILFSAMVIGANLVVDLLYNWLDPRVRVGAPPGSPRTA